MNSKEVLISRGNNNYETYETLHAVTPCMTFHHITAYTLFWHEGDNEDKRAINWQVRS